MFIMLHNNKLLKAKRFAPVDSAGDISQRHLEGVNAYNKHLLNTNNNVITFSCLPNGIHHMLLLL